MEEYTMDKVLPEESIRPLAFQMVYSLYVAQVEFHMRHYDVKLLNFLLKSINDKAEDSEEETQASSLANISYGVAGAVYRMQSHLWVKLADFGTADVDADSLGSLVGLDHFTTLENSPIEYLFLGSGAQQDYSADTWQLGLSMLHMFTGHKPYEELMEEVVCPAALRRRLMKTWEAGYSRRKSESVDSHIWRQRFEVIRDVMSDGDASREESELDPTLADTLYRFLVLLGVPSLKARDGDVEDGGSHPAPPAYVSESPVWETVTAVLGPRQRRFTHEEKDIQRTFDLDRSRWSLDHGDRPIMEGARLRMDKLGGLSLVKSMLCFESDTRPTLLEVLGSSFFVSLREPQQHESQTNSPTNSHEFLKYL